MLTARRVSSFAISKSWAHTLERPQFPNRSKIRASSLSIVSTTGPGLRINFSRSDDTGGDLLLSARSDETDASASAVPTNGENEQPRARRRLLLSRCGLVDETGRVSRVHFLSRLK